MAQVKIYNLEGKEAGDLQLADNIFTPTAKPELIYQVVKVLRSRARQPLAHTKDRGEVRGGGKKPWKQKGTGRARHGSIRSPLWKGGGVTFGPRKENITALALNKKMSRLASRAAFAEKLRSGNFYVIDDLRLPKPSAKTARQLLSGLNIGAGKILFALSGKDEQIFRLSLRNLPQAKSVNLENIGLLDLLACKNLLASKKGAEKLIKIFS